MGKNIVVSVVFGLIFASLHPAEAQQPAKVRKIGLLIQRGEPSGSPAAFIEPFRQGMRGLGYIEGQNIIIEYRSAERGSELTELANELVREKVELIVAAGPGATAVKKATETIPIVFTYSGDPIEADSSTALRAPEEI